MSKKVFIIGATGFIGLGVAQAFVRHGYDVSGLARSSEKAKLLQQNAVAPVIGTAQDYSSWSKAAEEADIIVEAVADYTDRTTPLVLQKSLLALVQQKPHITILYTSGVWVWGADQGKVFDESQELNPLPKVTWRPAVENSYLEVGGVVLRPGILYGKTGSLTGSLFQDAKTKGRVVIGPNQHLPPVHVDDLGEAYVLAAEKKEARGQAFNIVGHQFLYRSALERLQSHIPFDIAEETSDDPFLQAVRASQRFDTKKAEQLLGWKAKAVPLDRGIVEYYKTWEALSS